MRCAPAQVCATCMQAPSGQPAAAALQVQTEHEMAGLEAMGLEAERQCTPTSQVDGVTGMGVPACSLARGLAPHACVEV